ncbi:muramidase family protein [Puia dinghuensis]|uniref:LysM domain-containing protein n=1 Tax=Puia dinghuensis TaxID=1792502 RepID=A0A8J2UI81_9BACT|nr:LysM domain-containing protein [Puia dinghuensis]GGB21760.1 hypothetical protein GCM10011511_52000 [Puia dinghuensis]
MRSPATVLLLIGLFFIKFAKSQSNELIVFGQTGKLYLEHTVVAKENWYSVGRLYNISPKELAPFNHLTLNNPLIIGQILQIPLTAVNFSQTMQKTPAETLIPVYYITQEKEWMYRISVNHNKVPIPTLEKWNNMNKDAVHPGMHLIVGYLKVKTDLSALATTPTTTRPAPPPPPVTTTAETKPVTAKTTDTPSTKFESATTTTQAAKPAVTAKETKEVNNPPATTTSAPATTTTAPATTPVSAPPTTTSPAAPPAPHFDGGVFKADFLDNGKTASGVAGIFKSTSGWQDGKYYALMNNVAIGSIVKVTDGTSGRSVYVKVLGQLPDMKESAGLTIRISNAAAAEMGATSDRFNVQVNY